MQEESQNEAVVIARVQAGDTEAFAELVENHVRRLRVFVALRAPVVDLVDEVVHQSFIHAFRHIQEFTPGGYFHAWLRAIAGNRLRAEMLHFSREHANRRRYAAFVAQSGQGSLPDEADVAIDYLERCLEGLPPTIATLVHLRYSEERSSDDIAARLGRSAAWVRTTLCRVRDRLRRCIEERMASEGEA